jgi:enamine deaminase RidA (YjgF/YER057c/UK114 family)
LKSKNGISNRFYSHSEQTPIYGNGQGAGDSPSQWSQESALLFDLYEEAVTGAQMSFRNGTVATKLALTAFADDTNLLGNDDHHTINISQLVEQAKQAFQTWDKLLHATGHFMELAKCACYLSVWKFQEDGYAYTVAPADLNVEIKIQDANGAMQTIRQLPTDESQKVLGVMRNPIGNQQDEVIRLQKKSETFASKINSQLLNHADAVLAYEAFYLPAMRYSLAITSINQLDFENIQCSATTAFLAAMGYNRNMPRTVTYAPKMYQGLGLRHLYDVQGCDGIRLLLQELNMQDSSTCSMIQAVLDTIQLESGIGKPILEETRPLDYIEWGWIPQIRDFLQHIDARIMGATQTPLVYRENDQYLMDSPTLDNRTYKERMLIHRCRIFLQVEVLSDISDAAGESILGAWLEPNTKKPSYSLKKWQEQSNPGKEAWKIWRRFITEAFTSHNRKLRTTLGKWTRVNSTRAYYSYRNGEASILYTKSPEGTWRAHVLRCAGRRCLIFQKDSVEAELPSLIIPIDITLQTNDSIIAEGRSSLDLSDTENAACNSLKEYIELTAMARSERITLLVEESAIASLLRDPTRIEVASDGGFEPSSGISLYGWVKAFNRTLIAKGRGPAEAHPDLAESFRSEGYGLASVAAFLMALVKFMNVSVKEHTWRFYIDNKAMIQRMESYHKNIRHSRWNLRSDADITNKAHHYLRHIPATLIHVKSHQDDAKDNRLLTFDAQLNIMADAMATQQCAQMNRPVMTVTGDHCHLVIKDKYITREAHRSLVVSMTTKMVVLQVRILARL